MFKKMAENKLFCQEILRAFMGDPGLIVLKTTPQSVLTNLYGRSVTLDAYCLLSNGRNVNIEVQNDQKDNHQKRVRYNGSLLTARITNPGATFEDVPDVCVIYITRFDIFKGGRPIYHIDRTVRETGKTVYNGFEEIYVNAAVNDGSDIAQLMDIFINDNAYSDKFPVTSSIKRLYKNTQGGKIIMGNVSDQLIEWGRKDGLKKGFKKGHREGHKEGHREGHREGRSSMQRDLNALNIRLIKENRISDLERAATDTAYQAKLLKELFPRKQPKGESK